MYTAVHLCLAARTLLSAAISRRPSPERRDRLDLRASVAASEGDEFRREQQQHGQSACKCTKLM